MAKKANQVVVPAQETQVAPIIQMIERVVMSPDVDIDKLEKMMMMQERMLDRDQEAEFNRAMVDAQSEMPVVAKTKTNNQTHSMYATLDAINIAIVPVYTKHGFAVSFDTDDSPLTDHIRVVAHVAHRGGYSRTYKHDLPIDNAGMTGKVNKTLMHGRASTVSYGQRYLLTMIFNVATGADQDGNRTTQVISEDQAANIKALMDDVGADESRFLKYAKAESIKAIPANRYDWVIDTLEKKRT